MCNVYPQSTQRHKTTITGFIQHTILSTVFNNHIATCRNTSTSPSTNHELNKCDPPVVFPKNEFPTSAIVNYMVSQFFDIEQIKKCSDQQILDITGLPSL